MNTLDIIEKICYHLPIVDILKISTLNIQYNNLMKEYYRYNYNPGKLVTDKYIDMCLERNPKLIYMHNHLNIINGDDKLCKYRMNIIQFYLSDNILERTIGCRNCYYRQYIYRYAHALGYKTRKIIAEGGCKRYRFSYSYITYFPGYKYSMRISKK
ncbi:Hypothetical protein ORPV_417 [Orpheovirus IHUMI-LCC2]|uniref:F-box domain-containing protein n=1 Tax=Orpheovirus IHUMI-LCC2 TaxID=2023057 RepID=A0A2I2L482_9VIRU|nr:Hypothetical protein ORPV_417 [Orpheovirus IHUMI-LCC2]SNW62321.1 Hypothetical protein ORPV_417 [Orpheovirus IHUMI-LCC2]